jgi:predicted protein tyrosine phosphatase
MEKIHRNKLQKRFRKIIHEQMIICLDIPEEYRVMDERIVALRAAWTLSSTVREGLIHAGKRYGP